MNEKIILLLIGAGFALSNGLLIFFVGRYIVRRDRQEKKNQQETMLLKWQVDCIVFAFMNLNGELRPFSTAFKEKYSERMDAYIRDNDILNQ